MNTSDQQQSRTFRGEFSDGVSTANTADVLLEMSGDEVVIHCLRTETVLQRWPVSKIDIDSNFGVVIVRFRDNPSLQFVCKDLALARVFKGDSRLQKFFDRVNPRAAAGVLLLIFIGLMTAIWFSTNTISQAVAQQISPSWESRVATKWRKYLASANCATPEADAAVKKIFKRLVGQQNLTFDVSLFISNIAEVNAYAFPGGSIVLNAGFLQQAGSPEEIAAVLGHEIQHLEQRHVMASLVRASFLAVIWSVMFGDMSSMIMVDPSLIHTVATSSFSRQQETSADRGALEMLDRAQISKRGFVDFFQKMSQVSQSEKWLTMISSHPASHARIASAGSPPFKDTHTPILSEFEFSSLKKPCQSEVE